MTAAAPTLARTPLYSWHAAHGARLVDFSGWEMPVQYSAIVAEHRATRTAAALFDVSHMGRLRFAGPGAEAFLDRLLTRKVVGLRPAKVRYSLVCNEAGGILDDVLVYHLPDTDADPVYWLVVNAGNRAKIVAWIEQHADLAAGTTWEDRTLATAMIALQGPLALEILLDATGFDARSMPYYSAVHAPISSDQAIVSRTGYTGEDGCELVVPAAAAEEVWQRLYDMGRPRGLEAAGLGARDTLRLEAAMPLYGHELSESIDPYQAGLGFAVDLQGRDFIGRQALEELSTRPPAKIRVGLSLAGRRVPREQCPVVEATNTSQVVGEVTSGTFSPTLLQPIAMAYVEPDRAAMDTQLAIDIRGKAELAAVVKLPFYKRSK
jgi:aminomethyltransferase